MNTRFDLQLPTLSRRSLLLASAALALPSATRGAPIEPMAPGIALPPSRAGQHMAWVLEQVNRKAKGLTIAEIKERFAPDYLAALPARQLRDIIKTYAGPNGPFSPARLEGETSETRARLIAINAGGDTWRIRLGVEPHAPFLINALFFEPVGTPIPPRNSPTDWHGLTEALRDIAPRVSFAAAELTPTGPRWLSRLYGDQQRAIASSFKLYVLGELSRQISSGTITWDDLIPIQDTFCSLPNGTYRYLATGTQLTLRDFADQMISTSDNTATDHLIGTLGRAEVQSAFAELGHSQPERNLPLLLTREWFAMRMRLRDTQIERYLGATSGNRLRILANTVGPLADQLTEYENWPGPRFLDKIEWFAGAADLVRAMDWHWRNSHDGVSAPIRDVLSLNPGICWSPLRWRYVGYKGGYETGAMSDAWLLQRQDGRWFAFAAVINDTRREINMTGLWSLHAATERLLSTQM